MLNLNNIKKFFDDRAQNWDDGNSDLSGAKKIVKQFSDLVTGCDILDIGCGTGVLTMPLQNAGAKSIVGIDISSEMINIAKEKFPQNTYICEDILKWQSNKCFDTIFMYNVYPHLSNTDELINKIWTLLKKDGHFIVAHGSSKENINSHHQAHAMEVSRKLLKAEEEAQIWRKKFDVNIIRDNELYYFSGKKIN